MSSNVDLKDLAIDRAPSPQTTPSRRHLVTRFVLPGMLLVGFLMLVAWASRDYWSPPTKVAVVPVFSTTAEVSRSGTPLFKAAGWIEPRPTPVRVAALASGVVETLLVVEDEELTAGQPVAELIRDDAQLAYDRALADLELRHAEHDEARAALVAARTRFDQPVHLDAALGDASASLARIETSVRDLPFAVRRAAAELVAAKKVHEGKLAAQGVVPGVQIDIAKSEMDAAQAMLDELTSREASLQSERTALIARRDALQKQLELLADETLARDTGIARLRAAAARVNQAEIAVADAKLQLDRMTVRAPVAGHVYQLLGHPGASLSARTGVSAQSDGRTVITMYRPDRLQVRVDVRFEDIPRVSLHQEVEIKNPTLPRPITGRVLFISSEADIQKNTLQVKVEVPGEQRQLKPEMLVDATFLAPAQDGSNATSETSRIYVPASVIHQAESGAFVWLADLSEGVARRTFVATSDLMSEGLVEITAGLTAASRIIVSGHERLDDGDRIHVTGEAVQENQGL